MSENKNIHLPITLYAPGQKPQPHLPGNQIYEILGEAGIRQMISDHYDLLIQSDIKHLFPTVGEELDLAKQRAADFIIQRFGGPNYYEQRRGKPLLANRHARFVITPKGRITWLNCYREALLKQNLPTDVLQAYWQYLDEFSNWMVNANDEHNYTQVAFRNQEPG